MVISGARYFRIVFKKADAIEEQNKNTQTKQNLNLDKKGHMSTDLNSQVEAEISPKNLKIPLCNHIYHIDKARDVEYGKYRPRIYNQLNLNEEIINKNAGGIVCNNIPRHIYTSYLQYFGHGDLDISTYTERRYYFLCEEHFKPDVNISQDCDDKRSEVGSDRNAYRFNSKYYSKLDIEDNLNEEELLVFYLEQSKNPNGNFNFEKTINQPVTFGNPPNLDTPSIRQTTKIFHDHSWLY